MFTKELFGQRILELRKQNGETQTDLANVIQSGKSHISEMEKGKMTTTIEKLALICEHYKVSANYLMGLSDDPELR
ncbi:MAG: helix-turn-helix domain-containing protein [Oscillospiraceae bacterium]|nr:helix-turn-helix transcriptional regulator [Oscillospiraceae bacterium]MDE6932517.1 helix-turn-helix domain-containing protein [Oscillospiraceae bacterium]